MLLIALATPALLPPAAGATPVLDGRRTGLFELFRTITYTNTSTAQPNAFTVSRDDGTGELVFRPSDDGVGLGLHKSARAPSDGSCSGCSGRTRSAGASPSTSGRGARPGSRSAARRQG